MIHLVLQWLVYGLLAGCFWLVGRLSIHIRDFGWFAGLMIVAVACVVTAIVLLERRKAGEETHGSR